MLTILIIDDPNYLTMKVKKLFHDISSTFLDQMMISFIQFLIGILFIYKSTPEEYGYFSFFLAIYYLIAAAQNALINTPLMVLTKRLPQNESNRLLNGVFGLLLAILLFGSILAAIILKIFSLFFDISTVSYSRIFLFLIAIIPLILRDFWRAEEFAQLKPNRALKLDSVYALIMVLLLFITVFHSELNCHNVFFLMFIAASIVTIIPTVNICKSIQYWDDMIFALQRSWELSCWSFLGATSSWLQNQAFVYLPFFLIGVKEVAYISAARLVMMPPALLASAWGNYFRPVASQKLFYNEKKYVFNFFILSTTGLLLILCLYTSFILFGMKLVPGSWIPENYQSIDDFIIFWAVIIFFTTLRSNISYLYQAAMEFKSLSIRGMVSAVVTIAASWFFILEMGINGTLVGRILGELSLIILLISKLKKQFVSIIKSENNPS